MSDPVPPSKDIKQQTAQERRLMGLTAFDRHQWLMKDAIKYYRAQLPPEQQTMKTDFDVLKEQYRFVRSEEDDSSDSWEVRMARRYYAKLFKEYAIADLSRYKESKVGLRWRTEQEVVVGKGQFACGAKGCDERRALASYEVNFAYKETGEHKQALVKLRLCPKHALQLNHKQNHKLIKKRKREQENVQAHVSKQPAHSSRDEMSPDVQDNAGSGGSSDAAAQVPDAAQASKLLDHKRRRSKQHEVFDGLFD